MTIRIFIIILLSALYHHSLRAQIEGNIYSTDSVALPGASVMITGTTIGAVSNAKGHFVIRETPRQCHITISYVGFKTQSMDVTRGQHLKIYLEEEALEIPEVVINAGENPAIPIIRKAMARREEAQKIQDHYRSTAYTKGVFLTPNSFEKLKSMGVVDSNEVVDSNGNVILYLAETLTQVTKAGGVTKEYILSSRHSGDPKGIALNFVSFFNINFEQSIISSFGNLINPIGSAAFQYYDYRLEGSYYENGEKYYKITLLPKRATEPVFQGAIYIADHTYDLKQADVFVLGKSVNQPLMDSIFIKQSYEKLPDYEKYVLHSQYFEVKGSFLFIKLKGYLTGFYNEYTVLPKDFKIADTKTIVAFDPLAPKKTEDYWNKIRPMALTAGEQNDYVKRDSLAAMYDSPAFKDSVDHRRSRFRFRNILGDYNFTRRSKGIYFGKTSFVSSLSFDPVQGLAIFPSLYFTKEWASSGDRLRFTVKPSYGFSEKKFRYSAGISYNDKEDKYAFRAEAGNMLNDYNDGKPLSRLFNSIICLAQKINYTRLYDSRYYQLNAQMQVHPDLRLSLGGKWEQRSLVPNYTDFSFFKKEAQYAQNYPSSWGFPDEDFVNSKALLLKWGLHWHPGTRFLQLPDTRVAIGSAFPTFSILGQSAVALGSDYVHYNLLQFQITGISKRLYTLGTINANIYSGIFLGQKPQYRIDYKDFSGHMLYVKESTTYLTSFKYLPYYMHSTDSRYVNWFAEWNLGGYLFKKIPLLRKTGFEEVLSCNGLVTGDPYSYLELGVGLDKIGWNVFRPFRFDYFWRIENGKVKEHTFTVGVNFNIVLSLAKNAVK
jgi:hypothetical protein